MDKLKSYSKNSKYPKVKKYARQALDEYNERVNQDKEVEEMQGLLEDEIYGLGIYLKKAKLIEIARNWCKINQIPYSN